MWTTVDWTETVQQRSNRNNRVIPEFYREESPVLQDAEVIVGRIAAQIMHAGDRVAADGCIRLDLHFRSRQL